MLRGTGADAFSTNGLVIGDTAAPSGQAGLTDSFQLVTFDKTKYPVGVRPANGINATETYINIQAVGQTLTYSSGPNGGATDGERTIAADTEVRIPVSRGKLYVKAAAACNVKYTIELQVP